MGLLLPGPFDPVATSAAGSSASTPTTGEVTDLYTECDGRPLRAPNDLVMDGHGGFWFTDHGIRDTHGARTSDLTGIYYARCDGSEIREVVYPVEAPNGIGLSPDGATLYWAETHTGRVFQRQVVEPGELADVVPLDPSAVLRGLPGVPVARLAGRRRRGLGLRGDAPQRRRHRRSRPTARRSSSCRRATR